MAKPNELVNFNLPSPYQAEMAKIADQRRMAEMLQAQSQAPTERFSYKGIEARTPFTAGLAKALQGLSGAYFQKQAREEEKALGERYREQSAGEAKDFLSALRGTPAVPEKAMPQTSFAPSGSDLTDVNVPRVPEGQINAGNVVQPAYTVPAVAGVPADRGRALALAMQSINPMLQSASGALLAAEMPKASKWEKAELPKSDGSTRTGWVDINATNPATTFIEGGTKPPEVHFVDTNGKIVPVSKVTGAPVANAQSITKEVSPNTVATLKQSQDLADRAFYNLSAAQKAQDRREAQRLGLSQQEFNLKKWQADNPSLSFQETETGPIAFNPKTGVAAPVTTPAGTPLPGGKPLTESQGNATAYGMRMASAEETLQNLAKTGNLRPAVISGAPLIGGVAAQSLPTWLGGNSDEQQQVKQAKTNFITAVLRKESGAVISPSEFDTEDKKYFPQVNDGPKTIKQKADARQLAIKAIKIQAGPGAKNISTTSGSDVQSRADDILRNDN